jgi:hypothetical protein
MLGHVGSHWQQHGSRGRDKPRLRKGCWLGGRIIAPTDDTHSLNGPCVLATTVSRRPETAPAYEGGN